MNSRLIRHVTLGLGLALGVGSGFGASFQTGDIFASVGNGKVNWYHADGTLVQQLDTLTTGFTTGSATDSAGNLYVTDFNSNAVTKFDNTGTRIGTFGSGYNSDPESILFDAAGNAYVGQPDGSRQILKFDSTGALLNTYSPSVVGDRGTDWIDLAADQHTLYYTGEGTSIKRFDLATSTQLSDFATLGGAHAFALRILSDGGVLVADTDAVRRLDAAGNVVQTYSPTGGSGELFALNLDPDGTSFWTGDDTTGIMYKVNIATGATEQTLNTNSAELFGVSVFGEITQSGGGAVPEPSSLALVGTALLGLGLTRKYRRAS